MGGVAHLNSGVRGTHLWEGHFWVETEERRQSCPAKHSSSGQSIPGRRKARNEAWGQEQARGIQRKERVSPPHQVPASFSNKVIPDSIFKLTTDPAPVFSIPLRDFSPLKCSPSDRQYTVLINFISLINFCLFLQNASSLGQGFFFFSYLFI